jgi:lycopene cyclase-like protein
LFNLDNRFRVGIEDGLWAASVGGMASVIGEILLKERLTSNRKQRHKRHYAPFVAMAVLFAILEFSQPCKTIYNTVVSFTVCAIVIAFLRSDLMPSMLVGALSFTLLYAGLFVYFLLLYPDFVQRYYNVANLLGIYIRGVPIEEIMFSASGGAVWSVAYEYLQGFRLLPGGPFRFVQV